MRALASLLIAIAAASGAAEGGVPAGGGPWRAGPGPVDVRICEGRLEGALAGDTVLVAVRLESPRPGLFRVSVRGEEGAIVAPPYPVFFAAAGDSVCCHLPVVVPFLEEVGESIVVEVWGDDSTAATGRAAAPIGPTTPGIPFAAPVDPGNAADLDVRWPLVLLRSDDSVQVVRASGGGTEAGLTARAASLGNGFLLYESGRKIFRRDLRTGETALLSDPLFASFEPAAGDSFSLWFRTCCGTLGELCVLPEGGRPYAFPLEAPPSSRPCVAGRRAAWLETGEGARSLWTADLASREKKLLSASGDSIGSPAVDGGAVLVAARDAGGWDVVRFDLEGGTIDTLARGLPSVRDLSVAEGAVLWRERSDSGWGIRGVRVADGRRLPVCLAPGDRGPFAARDSVAVWIDRRSGSPSLRGLLFRLPPEPSPEIRFRFRAAQAIGGRVVLEWSVDGEIGRAVFVARRVEEGVPGEGFEVARGEIEGPGTYFCEDRSIPEEGERQRVRYTVSLEVQGGTLTYGPVAVVLPDRFRALAIVPASANPSTGDVRFALEIPAGSEGEAAGLSVYDLAGRVVREVDAGSVRAGRSLLVWDRRDESGHEVGAGVYFLRFRVGRPFQATRKVVLLPRGN